MKAIETRQGWIIMYKYVVEITYRAVDNEVGFIGLLKDILGNEFECSYEEYTKYITWLKNKNTEEPQ